jgi:hypothetical protein
MADRKAFAPYHKVRRDGFFCVAMAFKRISKKALDGHF